eukprot:3738017-Prymnesium_polylepis.1
MKLLRLLLVAPCFRPMGQLAARTPHARRAVEPIARRGCSPIDEDTPEGGAFFKACTPGEEEDLTQSVLRLCGGALAPSVGDARAVVPQRSARPRAADSGGYVPREAPGGGIDNIVREELASLARLDREEQEERLPTLLQRVEQRTMAAAEDAESDASASNVVEGYQFGNVTKAVVEATRGEVQRQLEAEWTMDDLSLLLKVGIFLGAGATAPVTGLAALPAAALLTTFGTVLKAELGVRAVQEVGARMAERAAQGIADGVKDFTGKEGYAFGDITEAAVRKMGKEDWEDYRFGDVTRGAAEGVVRAATGRKDYKFGQLTEGAVKAVTGNEEYRFGDFTKSIFKRMKGGDTGDVKK